jgi:very-short-patch-repair endonuclease
MTDAERILWFALRGRRFAQAKFRRQVPLGPFIADFLSFERRIVVEVDGGQHAGSGADFRRDAWFAARGFRVLRFWNHDVLRNIDGVLTKLATALSASPPHPARASRGHPSPTRGEGNEPDAARMGLSPKRGEGKKEVAR